MVKVTVTTNVARLAQRLAGLSDAELQRALDPLTQDELDELRELSAAEFDAAEPSASIPELEEAERLLADENEGL